MDDIEALTLPPAPNDTTPFEAITRELIPEVPVEAQSDLPARSRLRKALHAAKFAVESTVVAFELSPFTNEPARYGTLAAVEFTGGHNPLLGAAVLGGSTLVMEGVGALAASDILTSKTGDRLFKWVNKKLTKNDSRKFETSRVAEAAIALYIGAPTAMAVKQSQNPSISKEEIRRYGLITTAWVSGVCAVEGAAIAEGLGGYANPEKIAIALGAVGLIKAVPSWIRKRLAKKNINEDDENLESAISKKPGVESQPKYNLTQEELNALDQELTSLTKEKLPQSEMAAVWLQPGSKYANFVRTHEASFFPEVKEVSEEAEENTLFLALVDLRSSSKRIVHAATVTGVKYNFEKRLVEGAEQNNGSTGLYTIDELVKLGNFSVDDFYSYYEKRGIDPKKCISVETNFTVGGKTPRFHGLRMADLAYLEFFKMVEKRSPNAGGAAVFATINRVSIQSLKRVGVECELLMGQQDLKTPEAQEGRESLPVALPYTAHNRELFEGMQVEIPELFI